MWRKALFVGLVGALAVGAFAVVLYQLIMRPQEVAELAPRDWS
jgi:hypothetical protein